jgi:integrase
MKIPDPSFALKEPNSKKESLLFMKVYINYKRITVSTGVKIQAQAWDNKKNCLDKKILPKLEKEFPGLSNKAKTIEKTIGNYTAAFNKAVTKLDMLGEEWDEKELKVQIQKELGITTGIKRRVTLTLFIESYIKDIEDGIRLTAKGKAYARGTIKNYKGFQEQFIEFQKAIHKQIDFDDVTLSLKESLVAYFIKKNYSPNTIWRHIKHLKSIMNVAFEDDLHKNLDFQKRKFMTSQVATSEIYLNESELDALRKVDLSGKLHLDLARDVFLIGCYTAQRYSDYSRISKEHIKTTPGGNQIISLTQAKTGTPVIIPLWPELDSLLRKYDYTLPTTHEQKVNKYIKEVAQMAKITGMEADEVYTKGKMSHEYKPKCDLVKTHTARRSGATNLYLKKYDLLSIMRMTGHKTEREFLKYIRISNEENADNLFRHSHKLEAPAESKTLLIQQDGHMNKSTG